MSALHIRQSYARIVHAFVRPPIGAYSCAEVRGRVVETAIGVEDVLHVDALTRTYLGTDYLDEAVYSERVILKIAPDSQTAFAPAGNGRLQPGLFDTLPRIKPMKSNEVGDRSASVGSHLRWRRSSSLSSIRRVRFSRLIASKRPERRVRSAMRASVVASVTPIAPSRASVSTSMVFGDRAME